MTNGSVGTSGGGSSAGGRASGPAWVVIGGVGLLLTGWAAFVMNSQFPDADSGSAAPATVGVTSLAPPQTPQVVGGNAPVLVRLTLRNDYPQAHRQILNAALDILPAREVPLAAPTSVPDLIRQQYRVTSQNNPGLYALLEQRVRSRSEVIDGRLATGVARIPQLSPLVTLPAFAAFEAAIELRAGGDRSSAQVPMLPNGRSVLDPGEQVATTTSYLLQATVAELDSAAWQTLLADSANRADVELIAQPFDIDLGVGLLSAPRVVYEAPADPAWRAAIKSASRDVMLFVLDSGWPDEATWRASLTDLDALVTEVRIAKKFGKGPSLIPTGGFIPPDAKSHCLDVHESLAPFAGLSPRVRTVYVPLARTQGAERLLRELIVVGLAINILGDNTAASQVDKALKEAEAQADQHLNTISTNVANARLTANVALLRGLFLVAEHRAAKTNGRYFVNASWTTKEKKFFGHPVWPPAGFVVAAAGNDNVPDVSKAGVSFAGLTRNTKTGVAVLNLDANGITLCNSSLVTPRPGDLGAVAYEGRTANNCGTSFAAPRVSWILAAWDSLRNPADKEDYGDWIARLRKRLEPQGSGTTLKQLIFDPSRFFSQ